MGRATQGIRITGRSGRRGGKVRVSKKSGGTVIQRYKKDGVKYIRVQKYDYRNRLVSDNTYIEK